MGNDRPANATDSLPPQNNRLSLASYCCTGNRNIWVNGNVAHCLGSIPGIRVWFMLKARAEENYKTYKEIFTMHAFRLMPRLSTPTLSSTKATEWPWPIFDLALSNINQKRSWRTSRKSVSSVLISTVWKCVEMCGNVERSQEKRIMMGRMGEVQNELPACFLHDRLPHLFRGKNRRLASRRAQQLFMQKQELHHAAPLEKILEWGNTGNTTPRALARPYNDTLALGRLGNLAAWE